MRNHKLTSALIIFGFLASVCTEVYACSAVTQPSLASYTVKNADVIIRAPAIEFVEKKGVKFRVEEVLRGESVPSTFIFTGYLTGTDDFNNRPVPSFEYKQNAEYLFLLKRVNGNLTPYWYPLAPTNEQLRSKDDEWLKWVRNYLQDGRKQEVKVSSHFATPARRLPARARRGAGRSANVRARR